MTREMVEEVMTQELLPCPFCGSQPIASWKGGWRANLSPVMWTGCANGHRMIALPVDEWNTRTAPAAEIADLRAKLGEAENRVLALNAEAVRLCETICAIAEAREEENFEALIAAIAEAENEAVISASARARIKGE
jgi:hypothetical protein